MLLNENNNPSCQLLILTTFATIECGDWRAGKWTCISPRLRAGQMMACIVRSLISENFRWPTWVHELPSSRCTPLAVRKPLRRAARWDGKRKIVSDCGKGNPCYADWKVSGQFPIMERGWTEIYELCLAWASLSAFGSWLNNIIVILKGYYRMYYHVHFKNGLFWLVREKAFFKNCPSLQFRAPFRSLSKALSCAF